MQSDDQPSSPRARKPEMTEGELLAITDAEMKQSVGYSMGKLSEQRRQAEAYYHAQPVGDLAPPEVEGRSSVVTTDVADTIEWVHAAVLRVFASTDNAVEFVARKPGDEAVAKQATAYVNHVFQSQNPGYQITSTWFKDALLQKNGIVKVWWDAQEDHAREEYDDITDAGLAKILADDDVEPIEHSSAPDEVAQAQKDQALQALQQQAEQATQAAQQGDPKAAQALQGIQQQIERTQAMPVPQTHSVVVLRRSKRPQVRVENVPPEEFLISRRAKTIQDAPFVAHRVQRTVSELRAMGYANAEDIKSDDGMAVINMERVQRASFDDEWANLPANEGNGADESTRVVWLTEIYMRVDWDGDGIAEWRRITRAGHRILDNEECDGPPFVSITPVPLPHRFFGLSLADMAMPIQKTKTSVLRAAMDNLYLQVNGRYFAVEGQVNLDDLLTSRPGGVVRVKAPGMAGRLDQGAGDVGTAFSMLEYLETQKENRTGWTRTSQGLNADALNDTATGVNAMTQRADLRLESIARQFAETGVTDLFRMILKLVSKHQDRAAQIQVAGEWVEVDPRGWAGMFGLQINVGLGTGNKDQVVAHLTTMMQVQQQALQIGLATPENLYHSGLKLAENLALPNPEKYFTDPTKAPPRPPAPDPEQAKAQAAMQIEQIKLQGQMQLEQIKAQAQMQIEQAKAQAQAQVDTHRQQVEAQQKSLEMEQAAQAAQMQAQVDAAREAARDDLERWKAQLASDTQILLAQIKAGGDPSYNLTPDLGDQGAP